MPPKHVFESREETTSRVGDLKNALETSQQSMEGGEGLGGGHPSSNDPLGRVCFFLGWTSQTGRCSFLFPLRTTIVSCLPLFFWGGVLRVLSKPFGFRLKPELSVAFLVLGGFPQAHSWVSLGLSCFCDRGALSHVGLLWSQAFKGTSVLFGFPLEHPM